MMEQKRNYRLISSWYDEESMLATEFRRLYTKIRHLYTDRELRNFLITSATMGEGKSTTASLFAITVSKYRNTNTLLIDCDLRRPTIHKIFGLERRNGFIDAALGKKPLKSLLKNTFVPRLKVLTSGDLTSSPSEVFNLPRIKEIFAECRFYFDTLIVDCSPAIPVSDPLILSSETDGALLIVKAGKTPRELVKRAADLMRDAGVEIFGVVLNNYADVLPYYYRYRYDYYKAY